MSDSDDSDGERRNYEQGGWGQGGERGRTLTDDRNTGDSPVLSGGNVIKGRHSTAIG